MEYETWYEFKKDCEEHLGSPIPNRTWLEVKPEAPLPWNDTHKVAVLSRVILLRRFRRQNGYALGSQTEPDVDCSQQNTTTRPVSHIHRGR